jgi:S1-C subfamily serine protease
VDPNGESAQAGLQPGDIVQFVNRKPVRDVPELAKALSDKSTRSTLLEVRRGGSTYFFALPRY